MKVRNIRGDVRRLHQVPENAGALLQVASQFNLLEMVSPDVTPEQGVTRYQDDRTQRPACAIAAGAGTIYRNYFVPVGGERGQTSARQLDGLAGVGAALGRRAPRPLAPGSCPRQALSSSKGTQLEACGSINHRPLHRAQALCSGAHARRNPASRTTNG